MSILEMQKQMQKILLLFVTMAFEPVVGTYLCYQKSHVVGSQRVTKLS